MTLTLLNLLSQVCNTGLSNRKGLGMHQIRTVRIAMQYMTSKQEKVFTIDRRRNQYYHILLTDYFTTADDKTQEYDSLSKLLRDFRASVFPGLAYQ